MKKYRLLIQGTNFLVDLDGKPRKHGFYQTMFLEAASPRQAELLATTKLWHDLDLKAQTLNSKKDPPQIHIETFWEVDLFTYRNNLEPDRTFYLEKKWWQFWK